MGISDFFDFRIEHIIKVIHSQSPSVIGLQFPEGLKRSSPVIASEITDATGVNVIISANPCYGACDIDTALLQDVDLLFHFGHAQIEDICCDEKVVFIEAYANIDIRDVVTQALGRLQSHNIGLITTVQHIHKLSDARAILEHANKRVFIGKGDSKIAYEGQILGCNFSVVDGLDCEEFLYIGSGDFHPLGVSLATGKRVIIADPFSNEVKEVDTSLILRQRSAVIGNSFDAQTFGIIVSSKPGQYRMELAHRLKALVDRKGKKAFILIMDIITPETLLQFKMDAFVNTACPRIAVDDVGRFAAPMLTPQELEIVLGETKWEGIVFDEIRGD